MKKPSDRRRALSPDTLAVHAGREDFGEIGVHAPPLDLSTTYPIGDLEGAMASMDAIGKGLPPTGSFIYARFHNPTVARYEAALATLEGAEAAVAFSSGMAALTAALLAARESGKNHVVAVRPLYGGSDALLAGGLLGHDVTFTTPDGVKAAVRPDTCLVVLETPGNPTLDLVDIGQAVRDAGDAPVLVDSTFMTPILQRPLELGAAIVLHSATKFLGGHGDVIAGVLAASGAWAARIRKVRTATGALLHPLAAFLLHRGLPTLPLRVKAAQDGARIVAERLARHPKVLRVHYPGLPGADPNALLGRQMAGPGSVLSFEVAGGFEAARRVLGAVEVMVPAVSLGSTDTLIQHPAGLTHRCMSDDAKASSGISPSLLRLSVGLEDPMDLWADLEQALEAAHAPAPVATTAAEVAKP
jgi:methionine-gamma-lyase